MQPSSTVLALKDKGNTPKEVPSSSVHHPLSKHRHREATLSMAQVLMAMAASVVPKEPLSSHKHVPRNGSEQQSLEITSEDVCLSCQLQWCVFSSLILKIKIITGGQSVNDLFSSKFCHYSYKIIINPVISLDL